MSWYTVARCLQIHQFHRIHEYKMNHFSFLWNSTITSVWPIGAVFLLLLLLPLLVFYFSFFRFIFLFSCFCFWFFFSLCFFFDGIWNSVSVGEWRHNHTTPYIHTHTNWYSNWMKELAKWNVTYIHSISTRSNSVLDLN